jgi:modulator of FtsH protease HflK
MRDRFVDINSYRVPSVSPRLVAGGIAALVAILALSASLYQIQPEEVGVVLRLGRFVRVAEPGLRAKLPFAEQVFKVPVQRQLKQEFGFRTMDLTGRTRYSPRSFNEESVMLTGDLNVAVVEWIVQYRVSDPYQYLFKVRNLEDTFRNMNEAVMREVVGDRTVTEVLTVGRQAIEVRVKNAFRRSCNQYEMGVTVDQVVLQDVNPPTRSSPRGTR